MKIAHEPRLDDLADPALVISGDVTVEEVERLFVGDPALPCVVIDHGAGVLKILGRPRFLVELSGRLGYGRPLHSSRPIARLSGRMDTLALPGATTVVAAGQAVLARDVRHRYEDVLVRRADGSVGSVTVARLFEALADLHHDRALHDPLTGLANRELLLARLTAARRRALPGDRVCLLFVDIDEFKHINDSLGHLFGDQLLIVVADRLRGSFRDRDTVARIGGDEFVVLTTAGSQATAEALARRAQHALAAPILVGERTVPLRASIGVALDGDDVAAEELLRNADLAMYHAKREARSCVSLYRPTMHCEAMTRLELRSTLPGAVARDELALVYQPIVDLRSGATEGLEALVRWRHPSRGMVSPADFIPLAEQTGAIASIGAWVFETACRQVRAWQQAVPGGESLIVGVNVSARQLDGPGFADQVAATLNAARLAPDRVTLEITETAFVRDDEATLGALHALDRLGVRLAIDDFGTGYSSLTRLQRLPVGVIKLDKAFVARLDTGTGDGMLRGLLGLADAIGVRALAEGIETRDHLRTLQALDCPLGQGYHLSRPLGPDHVRAWLEHTTVDASLTADPATAERDHPGPARAGRRACG